MAYTTRSLTVDFQLDNTVEIPEDTIAFKHNNRTLFISNAKACCINVDSLGDDFVRLFLRRVNLGEAIASVCAAHPTMSRENLLGSLSDLLCRIETAGFYQKAKLALDTHDAFPLLVRLTERCNLRCTHCLISASPEIATGNEIDTRTWITVFDQYVHFSNSNGFGIPKVTFSGGEALLRPDLFDLAGHARNLGAKVELFSNGTLIVDRDIVRRTSETFDSIQISLDGASAKAHDAVRGQGTFARSVRALHYLTDAGMECTIATVVMPQNIADIKENIVELVKSFDHKIKIRLSLASVDGRATSEMQFSPKSEGENALRELLKRLEQEADYPPFVARPNLAMRSCGYCREMTIGATGDVYPCGVLRYSLGNVTQDSLETLMYSCIRNSRSAEVDFVAGCKQCNIRYLCGGLCRLINIAETGTADQCRCNGEIKDNKMLCLFNRTLHVSPIREEHRIRSSQSDGVDR